MRILHHYDLVRFLNQPLKKNRESYTFYEHPMLWLNIQLAKFRGTLNILSILVET